MLLNTVHIHNIKSIKLKVIWSRGNFHQFYNTEFNVLDLDFKITSQNAVVVFE